MFSAPSISLSFKSPTRVRTSCTRVSNSKGYITDASDVDRVLAGGKLRTKPMDCGEPGKTRSRRWKEKRTTLRAKKDDVPPWKPVPMSEDHLEAARRLKLTDAKACDIDRVGKAADTSGDLSRAGDKLADASGVQKVGGRNPINSRYAGKTHPSGVKFDKNGFPDFSPYRKAEVEIDGLTGAYKKDAIMANKAANLSETPSRYVWHHVEDGRTMQLIPKDIHDAARHTGGAAVIRHSKEENRDGSQNNWEREESI